MSSPPSRRARPACDKITKQRSYDFGLRFRAFLQAPTSLRSHVQQDDYDKLWESGLPKDDKKSMIADLEGSRQERAPNEPLTITFVTGNDRKLREVSPMPSLCPFPGRRP